MVRIALQAPSPTGLLLVQSMPAKPVSLQFLQVFPKITSLSEVFPENKFLNGSQQVLTLYFLIPLP